MTSVDAADPDLPPCFGRVTPGWALVVLLLLGVVAFGIYGYLQQRLHGDIVTGMRTIGAGGAAWGLYITFDTVFVGLAFGGIGVAALARVLRIRPLRSVARLGVLLAVVSLVLAGLCVVADLGRPLHGLLNLPRFARPQSPFFGTFTLIVGAGLSASLVVLFLGGRPDAAICARSAPRFRWLYRIWASGFANTPAERTRRRIASFWLAMLIFPLMSIAYSTLGFVFGVQSGRPGWFSALQAPGFVVQAALSGVGLMLVMAGLLYRPRRESSGGIEFAAFPLLGHALWMLLLVCLYFIAVEELTARYAAFEVQAEVARATASGVYAGPFWTSLAAFLIAFALVFAQFLLRRISIPVLVLAGLLANVGAILRRYLIVVPSQTHGTLLPFPTGTYSPSWVELAVILGLCALGVLMFMVVARFFPLVPLTPIGPAHMARSHDQSILRRTLRRVCFAATLLAGLALATIGLLRSARFDTLAYLDPTLPFSPVFFILGLVLAIGSAVVYEILPLAAGPGPATEHARSVTT